MLVQHERRLPGNADRSDSFNDLSRLREIIRDLYGSDAIAFAVDDFPDA